MIDRISIRGYKSIADVSVELKDINILIGGNGSGKSNFLDFFDFIHAIVDQQLKLRVAERGGVNKILHYGRKVTGRLDFQIDFREGGNSYDATLIPTDTDHFIFEREDVAYFKYSKVLDAGGAESELLNAHKYSGIAPHVLKRLHYLVKFHFHDTGANSPFNRPSRIVGNAARLRRDGGNLAAFLFHIREGHPRAYHTIVRTVQSVAPFFSDFELAPNGGGYVHLAWRTKYSDEIFGVTDLSDGTLRFIALACLFLQPELPDTIIIDEPELGLHPTALGKLAGLISSAAGRGSQVIAATQSARLLNFFAPDQILAADQIDGATSLRRLTKQELDHWLEDYTLEEVWTQGILTSGQVQ